MSFTAACRDNCGVHDFHEKFYFHCPESPDKIRKSLLESTDRPSQSFSEVLGAQISLKIIDLGQRQIVVYERDCSLS